MRSPKIQLLGNSSTLAILRALEKNAAVAVVVAKAPYLQNVWFLIYLFIYFINSFVLLWGDMFNYTHMIKAEQTEIAAVNNCRCFLGFVSRSSSINSPPHLPLQRKQPNMIPTSGIRKALTTDREVRRVRGRFSAMACKEEEKWPHENCNLTLHRLWRERTQAFGAMISGIVWVEKRELELVTVPLETTDLLLTNHN